MTREDVLDRLGDEVEVLWPGDQAHADATLEDLDDLTLAIDAVLEECRGFLEQPFGSDKETT